MTFLPVRKSSAFRWMMTGAYKPIGYGNDDGYGYCYGNGDGNGDGYGYGYGDGYGYGCGYGDGYGYGTVSTASRRRS